MVNRYLLGVALLVAQMTSLNADGQLALKPPVNFGRQLAQAHVCVGDERFKAVAALVGAGVALGGTNALSKLRPVRAVTEAVGLDADDVAKVIGVSGSCAALSFLASEDVGNGLWRFSQRAPVVGALFAFTCSRPAQAFVGTIPVLGPNLVCPTVADDAAKGRTEPTCKGVCRKCIMTKGITGTALYLAIDQAISAIFK